MYSLMPDETRHLRRATFHDSIKHTPKTQAGVWPAGADIGKWDGLKIGHYPCRNSACHSRWVTCSQLGRTPRTAIRATLTGHCNYDGTVWPESLMIQSPLNTLPAERRLMNKFQAMAQIMILLNEDDLLKPGSRIYKTVRKMVSDKIDRMGPEAALVQVMETKAHLLAEIKILCMWHKSSDRRP
jgi:hypothetical protein